ncbi:MAG: peroxiredoxin family protein [Flavisolibacter sp.]
MKLITSILFILFSVIGVAQERPEGLFINSKAPDFKAKDQKGNEISLKDLRKKGAVVLVFYRGNWSPYCTKYLKRLQDSLQLISDKKAQVIAVTPEGEEGIDSTIQKTGVSFPILFDKDMTIATNYRVAYKIDQKLFSRYKTAGIDLLKTNEQREAMLPVPAVYVINKEGSVILRFFDEDYKRRVPVSEILKIIY